MPEPEGIELDALETLLASIPRPIGAGLTGLVRSDRNASLVPRLARALGL